jgi:hypothetical protein
MGKKEAVIKADMKPVVDRNESISMMEPLLFLIPDKAFLGQ